MCSKSSETARFDSHKAALNSDEKLHQASALIFFFFGLVADGSAAGRFLPGFSTLPFAAAGAFCCFFGLMPVLAAFFSAGAFLPEESAVIGERAVAIKPDSRSSCSCACITATGNGHCLICPPSPRSVHYTITPLLTPQACGRW